MEENPMIAWADKLKALRDRKAELEAELKQINMDIDNAEWHLSEKMTSAETSSFTHAGTTFYLADSSRANAVPGKKPELYDALRAHGFGDLVTETVNANSLNSFVKEQIESNGEALPAWLEGLVKIYPKTTVGVRKAAR